MISTLSIPDEQSLIWFFGPGQSCFERSTFGIMLDRAKAVSCEMSRCRACKGTGFSGGHKATSARDAMRVEAALGNPSERLAAQATVEHYDDTCQACGGSGGVISAGLRSAPKTSCTAKCRKCKGATGNAECERCCGLGYTSSRPVRMTTKHKGESGYEPDGALMERYALISRRLRLCGIGSTQALQAYYGDRGARWEGSTGRILGVYHLTDPGKKILGQATEKQREGLSQEEIMASFIQLEKQKKSARGPLLRQADTQARGIYIAAIGAWNGSK